MKMKSQHYALEQMAFSEGDAQIRYPVILEAESVDLIEEWMALVIRKMRRWQADNERIATSITAMARASGTKAKGDENEAE